MKINNFDKEAGWYLQFIFCDHELTYCFYKIQNFLRLNES